MNNILTSKWLKFGIVAFAVFVSCLDFDVPPALIWFSFAGLGVYAAMLRAD